MRIALSSMTSTLVHAVALGGMAMWSLDSFRGPQFQVASGHAVTVQFSAASASSEAEQTIQIEAEPLPDTPVETHDVKHEAQKVEVERKATASQPVAEPARREQELADEPLVEIMLEVTKIVAEALPENDAEVIAEEAADRPTAQPPQHQVAAIPLQFQAADVAGANNPEQMPRKLPVNPSPPYPVDALLAGIEGRVIFRVRVAIDGTVEAATLTTSSGSASLDEAADATIRRWRFEPARRNGVPVAFEVLVPVTFSIRRS